MQDYLTEKLKFGGIKTVQCSMYESTECIICPVCDTKIYIKK